MSIKTTSAILRQIEALEDIAQHSLDGKIEVHYADGSVKWVSAGDAVLLAQSPDENIVAFTDTGTGGNGKLAALLDGLLNV